MSPEFKAWWATRYISLNLGQLEINGQQNAAWDAWQAARTPPDPGMQPNTDFLARGRDAALTSVQLDALGLAAATMEALQIGECGPTLRTIIAMAAQHGEQAPAACKLPPEGCYCTRAAGHDGPCAAHPTAWADSVPDRRTT